MTDRPVSARLVLMFLFVAFAALAVFSCDDDNPVSSSVDLETSVETLNFGKVALNAQKILTISVTNKAAKGNAEISISGDDKSAFSIDGETTISIDKDASANIRVVFAPTAEKTYSAVLHIDDLEITLTGEGAADLVLSLSTESLDFGQVLLNKEKTMTLAVQNITATKRDFAVTIDGTDKSNFSIEDGEQVSLEAGKSYNIVVAFNASAEKAYSAVLKLGSYEEVELKAQAVATLALNVSPVKLEFGTVDVGFNSEKEILVQNLAAEPITLMPSILGQDASAFAIVEKPAEAIPVGEIGKIKVRFSPTEGRSFTASLALDEDNSFIVPLTGTGGIAVDLQVTPTSLNYGEITTTDESTKDITLKNIYPAAISLTTAFEPASLSEVFEIVNQPTYPMNANSTGTMSIRFAPASAKTYTGKLIITTSNDNKFEVSLTGKGITPSNLELASENVSNAPVLDGNASDAAWSSVNGLSINLAQLQSLDQDQTPRFATIKSVNDGEYIYFLIEVEDATEDITPNQFIFTGTDPSNDTHWELSTKGQDGIGLMFPMTANVQDKNGVPFSEAGCWVACHPAEYTEFYESGSYPYKGVVDIWYWKAGTTNPIGHADDYYAMGMDYSQPDKRKQRRPDVDGKEFSDPNFRPAGTGENLPISIASGDNNGLNMAKYIWDNTSTTFKDFFTGNVVENNPATGTPWKTNDVVPGWKLRPQSSVFTGTRGDISASGVWKNGKWTVELKRKLNTETVNDDDVLLERGKQIPFSFSFFNNTRKWANFQYNTLERGPKPGVWGSNPAAILLSIE